MNILNHLVDYGESITLFNPDIVFITCIKEQKARYTAYHNKKGWYIIDDTGIYFDIFNENQKLYWVCELKNDFAQLISNQFSTQISRVGIDHYEWLIMLVARS